MAPIDPGYIILRDTFELFNHVSTREEGWPSMVNVSQYIVVAHSSVIPPRDTRLIMLA